MGSHAWAWDFLFFFELFFFFKSRDAYHGTYKPVARWERGQGHHCAIGVVARAQNCGRLLSRGVETVAPYLGCENIRIRGRKWSTTCLWIHLVALCVLPN